MDLKKYLKILLTILSLNSTLWSSDSEEMLLASLKGENSLEVFTIARVYGTDGGDFTKEILPNNVCNFLLALLHSSIKNDQEQLNLVLEQAKAQLQELQKVRSGFVNSEIEKISKNPTMLKEKYRLIVELGETVLLEKEWKGLLKDAYETPPDSDFVQKSFKSSPLAFVNKSFCNKLRTRINHKFSQEKPEPFSKLFKLETTPILHQIDLENQLKNFQFTRSLPGLIVTMEMLFGFHIPLPSEQSEKIRDVFKKLSDSKTIVLTHFLEVSNANYVQSNVNNYKLDTSLSSKENDQDLHFSSSVSYKAYCDKILGISEKSPIHILRSVTDMFFNRASIAKGLKATYKEESDNLLQEKDVVYEFEKLSNLPVETNGVNSEILKNIATHICYDFEMGVKMNSSKKHLQIVQSNTLLFKDESLSKIPTDAKFIVHVDPNHTEVRKKISNFFGVSQLMQWVPIDYDEVLRVDFLGYSFEIRKYTIPTIKSSSDRAGV